MLKSSSMESNKMQTFSYKLSRPCLRLVVDEISAWIIETVDEPPLEAAVSTQYLQRQHTSQSQTKIAIQSMTKAKVKLKTES